MIPFDLHTHSIASGHGTVHTIPDLAKAAKAKGMKALGISDHGPATPGSCRESYFRTLKLAPGIRCGIPVFYGVEANILDETGSLDLSRETLAGLDYVIASIHSPSFHDVQESSCPAGGFSAHGQPVGSPADHTIQYTNAYINAMKNPCVKIIGHPDDAHFPVNVRQLVDAAIEYKVILEVNEASLRPDGYRGNAQPQIYQILTHCLKYRHPILLSSDSHGYKEIGNVPYALKLVRELQFPEDLILNFSKPESFFNFR